MSISVKSGAVRIIDSVWILASLTAMTCAISANDPGALMAVTEILAGNLSLFVSSMSQRTSIQRSG